MRTEAGWPAAFAPPAPLVAALAAGGEPAVLAALGAYLGARRPEAGSPSGLGLQAGLDALVETFREELAAAAARPATPAGRASLGHLRGSSGSWDEMDQGSGVFAARSVPDMAALTVGLREAAAGASAAGAAEAVAAVGLVPGASGAASGNGDGQSSAGDARQAHAASSPLDDMPYTGAHGRAAKICSTCASDPNWKIAVSHCYEMHIVIFRTGLHHGYRVAAMLLVS